nr:hypothetical protein P413_14 [uncultured bacterium]
MAKKLVGTVGVHLMDRVLGSCGKDAEDGQGGQGGWVWPAWPGCEISDFAGLFDGFEHHGQRGQRGQRFHNGSGLKIDFGRNGGARLPIGGGWRG